MFISPGICFKKQKAVKYLASGALLITLKGAGCSKTPTQGAWPWAPRCYCVHACAACKLQPACGQTYAYAYIRSADVLCCATTHSSQRIIDIAEASWLALALLYEVTSNSLKLKTTPTCLNPTSTLLLHVRVWLSLPGAGKITVSLLVL